MVCLLIQHVKHRKYCQTYALLLKCEQVIRDFQIKQQPLLWLPSAEEVCITSQLCVKPYHEALIHLLDIQITCSVSHSFLLSLWIFLAERGWWGRWSLQEVYFISFTLLQGCNPLREKSFNKLATEDSWNRCAQRRKCPQVSQGIYIYICMYVCMCVWWVLFSCFFGTSSMSTHWVVWSTHCRPELEPSIILATEGGFVFSIQINFCSSVLQILQQACGSFIYVQVRYINSPLSWCTFILKPARLPTFSGAILIYLLLYFKILHVHSLLVLVLTP